MKVILKTDVVSLGAVGTICSVKMGYAKNYLIPMGYAIAATEQNVSILQKQMEDIKRKNDNVILVAKEIKDILDGTSFTFVKQTGDDGILYGSIKNKDISSRVNDFIRAYNDSLVGVLNLKSTSVKIDSPIKTCGSYDLYIKLFSDVEAKITLVVTRDNTN